MLYGPDESDFGPLATDADWDRLEARELGADRPDQQWILTDRDVWHRNPFYTGPDQGHPEDVEYYDDDDLAAMAAVEEFEAMDRSAMVDAAVRAEDLPF